jgi:hypothetical protein
MYLSDIFQGIHWAVPNIEKDVHADRPKGDKGGSVVTKGPAECIAKCRDVSWCMGYVWVPLEKYSKDKLETLEGLEKLEGKCWMKDKVMERKEGSKGFVSGVLPEKYVCKDIK